MADETKAEPNLSQLNDDLLKGEKPDEAAKRNTKEWTIERILSVARTAWNLIFRTPS